MISVAQESITYSFRVFITNIFIQLFSIYCIFSKTKEPFSFFKMLYLFSFFFYGVAPLLQFLSEARMWRQTLTSESEYFYCNIVVIFILTFYYLFYKVFQKLKFKYIIIDKFLISRKITVKKSLILVIISIAAFLIILNSNGYNFYAMILRGGDLVLDPNASTSDNESPTLWLLINNFVRPLSIMCFLFYTISPNKTKLTSFILLILALVTCFPTAMPRFAAAAMYIPVLLITVPFLRKTNVFSYTFVVGLLFVFPFLNIFRSYSEETGLEFKFDFEMFTSPHFDSFQNFALILSNNIITNGYQLLGVLFFWIPRSLWNDKPIGSGAFSATELNYEFANVSMNYFAEGFINFGFAGIFLFVMAIAFISAKFDKIYWKSEKNIKNSYFSVLYTVSLGFLFFILRGDLLSSVAYLAGFLSAAILVFKIAK